MNVTETKRPAAAVALKRILLATDFSQAASLALSQAAALARRYGSKVYLAHVITSELYPFLSPEALTEAFEDSQRQAGKQLTDLARQLEGIPHETLLGQGEVTDALAEMINRQAIDLIIVGTHGRRGIRRFLLGSVAEDIFRHSPCPVLTAGPHVAPASPPMSFRHILFPTDLSEQSLGAAPYACSLACQDSACLTVLHVLPQISATFPGARVLAKAFQEEMKKLITAEAKSRCHSDFEVELGNPAETILKVAKERHADLIVMGVRRARPLASHFEGNIAYQVVASAECPVLTVRNSGASD